MNLEEQYAQQDAVGLAELIKQGELGPKAVLQHAIDVSRQLNPQLNAIIYPMDKEAKSFLAQAPKHGTFYGVPFLIKDLLASYAGVRMCNGSRYFRDYVPTQDSAMVARFKQAGLLIFGKTNTPELGIVGSTDPEFFGPTRNPWNLELSAGGSSGGSAAAVAAGIVPAASGGDGGGSIRIPASYCGLVGLKPSRGRNPTGPDRGEIWQGQVQEGILSRTVRDTAAFLDITHGVDAGASITAPFDGISFTEQMNKPVGKLRIAYSEVPLMRQGTIDDEVREQFYRTVKHLKSQGHELVEAMPHFDRMSLAEGYVMRMCAEVAADIVTAERLMGKKPEPGDFELETRVVANIGASMSARDLAVANRQLEEAVRINGRFMEHFDLYLTPTQAGLAQPVGSFKMAGIERRLSHLAEKFPVGHLGKKIGLFKQIARNNFREVAYTPVANITGQPSISLPLCQSDSGLPIGMMFTANFGCEGVLLQLARQLEQSMPWKDRVPPVHVSNLLPQKQMGLAS